MKPWASVHRELVGAWRSMRYDLSVKGYGPPPRRRRMLSTVALALLFLAGTVGSYFAIVDGLAALWSDRPAAQQLPPPLTPTTRATSPSASPTSSGPVLIPVDAQPTRRTRPAPSTGVRPGPPTPTPAPTCSCTPPPVPTPTPSESTSPSESASPSPTASPPGEPTS